MLLLALADYATQGALGFLQAASDAAVGPKIDPGSRFHAALGLAYVRAGRFAEAGLRLGQALTTEKDHREDSGVGRSVGESVRPAGGLRIGRRHAQH